MIGVTAYCTVRVKRIAGQLGAEQIICPVSFGELVAALERIRDSHADDYAAAKPESGPELGGVGVELTNRWGGMVEVGPGRDAWFLFRHEPAPRLCHSDHPPIEGSRLFLLDGGHHTELQADMLVSRPECLQVLRAWLDSGEFPPG